MDDVRIVFTASQSWFGKLTRWVTKSTVSHVFVQFPVWGQDYAVEATVGGTRLVLAGKARHCVVAEYAVDAETKPALLTLMKFLGTEYDYTGVMVLAWFNIAWRWLRLKLSRPTWASEALKCSELLVHFLREIDAYALPEEWVTELVTPEDVRIYCSQQMNEFRQTCT